MFRGEVSGANRRLRSLCQRSPKAEFIDYLHLLFDEGGALRTGIFLPDRLHYAPCFYRELGAFLRPILAACGFERRGGGAPRRPGRAQVPCGEGEWK